MVRSTNPPNEPRNHLVFNKQIITTPKSPITTKDLLRRLQQLSEELSTIDQENPDFASFESIKKDLTNPKLLKSSNPGVQAYVSCSLADLLRIYAPEAPFTNDEIYLIFKGFFNQFKKLSDVHNPFFQQQCYLLKRLAEVRSVILITDIKNSEELIEMAFDVFYDLANKDFPQRLEPLICDILSEIMSEAEVVPHNVLQLILDKLLGNAAFNNEKISNPGFNFSVSICEANVDRMTRQVAQYFSEMLFETSDQIDKSDKRLSLKAIETLKKIHRLSIQIWRYIPGLLNAVMGLIDEELNADDETIRIMATETIGQMIGSPNTPQNFLITCKDTWSNWLKKSLDISPKVRCKWIEQLPLILINGPNLTSEVSLDLCNALNKCLLDSDEKVRLESCISVGKFPFSKFTRICNKDTLSILSQLIREKNADIRNQVISILSSYCHEYLDCISNDQVIDFGGKNKQETDDLEESFFQKIPNQLLSLIYINDKDINFALDMNFFDKVCSFEDNSIKRVERICQIFNCLDDKGKQAFFALSNRQQKTSKVVLIFIELCEKWSNVGSLSDDKENLSETDKSGSEERNNLSAKIDKTINWLCESLPDGLNLISCVERFYKLKNFRLLNLVKQAISPDSDFKVVKNSINEILTKLGNPKNLKAADEKSHVSTSDMVSTFKALLYRSSVILYNKSNVEELVNYSKNSDHEWHSISNEILSNISSVNPAVLTSQISSLVGCIRDRTLDSHTRVNYLKATYKILKKCPDFYPEDQDFEQTLQAYCLQGNVDEAKYSMKLIGLSKGSSVAAADILEKIFPLSLYSDRISTHLSTIAEILMIDRDLIDVKINEVSSSLIKEFLLTNSDEIDGFEASNKDNFVDHQEALSNFNVHRPLVEKLLVLKVFVKQLRSAKQSEEPKEYLINMAKPVIKLLVTLVSNGGEIVKEIPTPGPYQLRLRLEAGLGLLKLSKIDVFDSLIDTTALNKVASLLQDQSEQVRSNFLIQLQKSLSREATGARWLTLLFFMYNEPNQELAFSVAAWIKSMSKKYQLKKEIKFEKCLADLIHLLSHHSSFTEELDDFKAFNFPLEVLMFYFKNLINQDDISLLYYVSSRVKQFRDATIDQSLYDVRPYPQPVNNLYCIAELSQLIIKEYSDFKNWPTLSWPGKIQLPKETFTSILSTGEAQAIISKVYIPGELQIRLRGVIIHHFTSGNKKRSRNTNGVAKRARANVKRTKKSRNVTSVASESTEPSRKSSRARKPVNYGNMDENSDSEQSSQVSDEDSD